MITIETPGMAYVGTSDGELYFEGAGRWSVKDLTYIQISTNAQVDFGSLRDGATVAVDATGLVSISDGPDLIGASVLGFGLAFTTLGTFMAIRFVFRKALGGLSLGHAVD